jgi:hypothetical protein
MGVMIGHERALRQQIFGDVFVRDDPNDTFRFGFRSETCADPAREREMCHSAGAASLHAGG